MKLSSFLTALITALAAPAAAAPANVTITTDVALLNSTITVRQDEGPMPDVWCTVHQPDLLLNYRVIVRKVSRDEIGDLCQVLWKKLARHWFICTAINPSCEHAEVVPGEPSIEWKFTTWLSCNAGAIASAYWEATKNKYGAMDQSGCN
ncbi:hypothetical protein KVR01_006949 [Diaporthe batatas]|uniref:uncharacterized protein n=1 Tax=Diaporthe batatas TaxID=748121 RepID=UPI001D05B649|nr:uncharacterized protein KVR01_006949 [Diaporthe batatas]KAG8163652.1 hypothetical protein KVR01_006949 [Diaporthe batatas]